MADDNFDALYQITWGSLRLWCCSAQSTNGRTIVVHELAEGDEHPLTDRGLAARTTRLELLFDDFPTEMTSGIVRLRNVIAQVESGQDYYFTHPVRGSYLVKVSDFDYTVDDDSNVTSCTIEFIANEPIEPVTAAGPGTSSSAGQDAVQQQANVLAGALDDADIDSTIPDDAVAAQQSWSDVTDAGDPVPTRQIVAQTAQLSSAIATLIDEQGLEEDLALWPCFSAAIMLGDSIRASAMSATNSVGSTFTMLIRAPVSPLGLCARVYGGADASLRERQFRELNDLHLVGGMLRAGDVVIMPGTSGSIGI